MLVLIQQSAVCNRSNNQWVITSVQQRYFSSRNASGASRTLVGTGGTQRWHVPGRSPPEGTTTQQGVKDRGGLRKGSARKRSSGDRLSKQHRHLKALPPTTTARQRENRSGKFNRINSTGVQHSLHRIKDSLMKDEPRDGHY